MLSEMQQYKLTYSLIFLNLIAYLFSAFLSGNMIDMKIETLVDMGALYAPYVVVDGEWWRLLSAMFLHGGGTHLLMNMFSLYVVGRSVELYFTKTAYLTIYLFSGLLGGMASLMIHGESVGVGASGAIFGIFGALAGFVFANRKQMASGAKSFMKQFGVILGLNLVIGLSIPSVDVSAHIGGLIVGLLGGFILSQNPKWIGAYALVMALLVWFLGITLTNEYVSFLV